MALDDSIPTAKNYQKNIYFVFKLGEPALLGSKMNAYEYACISRYPGHIKNGIKNIRENDSGSIIILKMANKPLRNITSQCVDVVSILTMDMIIF